jgi:hypothetical protein
MEHMPLHEDEHLVVQVTVMNLYRHARNNIDFEFGVRPSGIITTLYASAREAACGVLWFLATFIAVLTVPLWLPTACFVVPFCKAVYHYFRLHRGNEDKLTANQKYWLNRNLSHLKEPTK